MSPACNNAAVSRADDSRFAPWPEAEFRKELARDVKAAGGSVRSAINRALAARWRWLPRAPIDEAQLRACLVGEVALRTQGTAAYVLTTADYAGLWRLVEGLLALATSMRCERVEVLADGRLRAELQVRVGSTHGYIAERRPRIRGNARTRRSLHGTDVCERCGALHVQYSYAKGYPGQARHAVRHACLRCAGVEFELLGVPDHGSYEIYLAEQLPAAYFFTLPVWRGDGVCQLSLLRRRVFGR